MAKELTIEESRKKHPEWWRVIDERRYYDLFSDMTPDQQEEILRQTRENEAKEKKHK